MTNSVLPLFFLLMANLLFGSDLEEQVDSFLKPYMEREDFSGSILIAKDGNILLSKGYGYADFSFDIPNGPDTKFRIGSVTKQFTAAAILILGQDGQIHVDDRLTKYVPEFPHGDDITIHHLLTHTSGLPRDLFQHWDDKKTYRTLEELANLIRLKPLSFRPGEKTSYSNCGYILLAHIIEKTSGVSYGRFLSDRIFKPLDMHHSGVYENQRLIETHATGYDPGIGAAGLMKTPEEDLSNSLGAGGIYSTVEDLYKWDRSFYDNTLLSESSINKMLTDYGAGRGYGFGIYRRFGHEAVGHDGISNGFTAFIDRYINDDAVVIYAGNIRSGALEIIQNGISGILFNEPYENYVPPDLPVLQTGRTPHLKKYVGKYELFPGFILEVQLINEHLYLSGTAGYLTYLHPLETGLFYYRAMYASVQFTETKEENVTELVWIDRKGQRYTAQKTE